MTTTRIAESGPTRVGARYFNEFWYFDTFPTSCYAPRTAVLAAVVDVFVVAASPPSPPPLLYRYIYYVLRVFSNDRNCRTSG